MAQGHSAVGYLEVLVRLLATVQPIQVDLLAAQLRATTGTVWVLGNGGSQANASHLVLHLREAKIRAHDLMDGLPSLSALSNDTSYQAAPMNQLRALGNAVDTLLVISGSGNSINVLAALAEARRIGMVTLGLLAFGGGAALGLCKQAIVLDSSDYGPVEDACSALLHMLSRTLLTFPRGGVIDIAT